MAARRIVKVQSTVAEGRLEVLQVYKLLQCVREGNTAHIEKMLRLGVPRLVDLTEPREGLGAMHLAVTANNMDMARFLLSAKANPNIQDKRGRTPVILATQLGHDTMVALLAKNHADMNLADKDGKGVLFYCLYPTTRHAHCLQVALNSKANVNSVCRSGKPVFVLACERARDCEDMCMSILEGGANPDSADETSGRTALMEAARAGSVQLVRAILQRGANPNTLDKKRFHAAHFAAKGGFFEVIQVLSAYSADLGVMATDGNTPLHFAAAGGFAECCRFLAQRGCNPKLKNVEGLVPRQIAKDKGQKAAMKELKKAERQHAKFSKPEAVNPNALWAIRLHDWSCEHEATLRSAFEMAEESDGPLVTVSTDTFVSVLKEHRAPLDDENLERVVKDHDNRREGVINVSDFFKGLKYLQKAFVISSYGPKKKKAGKGGKGKKKGKYVAPMPIYTLPSDHMARRPDGGPPLLMIERYQQFTDMKRFHRDRPPRHPVEDDSAWYIKELEKAYININQCTMIEDLESLSLAFSQGHPVDVQDRFYKTPLMTACTFGNYTEAKLLIELGADVNACDQFNWTPLHHACHAGQLDIIDLLVQSGAMVDAVAVNGGTPLMRAIESCRLSCVDYLIKAGANIQAANKAGQTCLDVAKLYGDPRIIELIMTKFDSLPKMKENKKGKGGEAPPKSKPAAPMTEKVGRICRNSASPSLNTLAKRAALRENIIFVNSQMPSGPANKFGISFVPRTVWGKELLTTQRQIERKMDRRKHLSYEAEFEDFMVSLSKSIMQKSLEMT
ncbi:ankyrin repeat and EF-hand domain-containing protein 1 [Chanos chanos]|uniref:Ankyrin repeat and EF-hand domain-containing protein 1 n=1 Tax=Chanos chanos TaxID=29144 RepID=A0A6J2WJI3_CHACN|nr:ankyrin repeat and EF-hand domain-containing protein 1-like [Chanos chanos]